jgi:hypothetical protein
MVFTPAGPVGHEPFEDRGDGIHADFKTGFFQYLTGDGHFQPLARFDAAAGK